MGGEGDGRGWDGWMASPTQWTWVWVNSGSWWWTGRPGVLQSMGSQRVGQDWANELNWTELKLHILAWRKSQQYRAMALVLRGWKDAQVGLGNKQVKSRQPWGSCNLSRNGRAWRMRKFCQGWKWKWVTQVWNWVSEAVMGLWERVCLRKECCWWKDRSWEGGKRWD